MNEENIDIVGFLKLVIDALNASGVEYLIGGAIAAWGWGEPRATQDIDLVIDLSVEAVPRLSAELGKRAMLVPAGVILDNLIESRADLPINAIHQYSGLKADLYPIREGDLLRQEAFARRVKIDFGPEIGIVTVHSPEDLILYKLIYFNISHQPKHTRDIGAILKSRQGQLDFAYIDRWVQQLGLAGVWQDLLSAA